MNLKLLVLTLTCAATVFADDPKLGETWYVSTAKLALRAKPDALSKAVKELKYKDAAKIKGVSRVAVPFDGDKDKFPDTLTPNWVKVEVGGETGYLPVSSLASEWLIRNQDPNQVVSSDGKTTFRDNLGRTQGTVQTDARGKTTWRDSSGRIQGTSTTDRYGKTTYRDGSGRIIGTRTVR